MRKLHGTGASGEQDLKEAWWAVRWGGLAAFLPMMSPVLPVWGRNFLSCASGFGLGPGCMLGSSLRLSFLKSSLTVLACSWDTNAALSSPCVISWPLLSISTGSTFKVSFEWIKNLFTIFMYVFGRQSDREILYPSVHSLIGRSGRNWTRLKARARNSIQISHKAGSGPCPLLVFLCLPWFFSVKLDQKCSIQVY